MSVMGCGRFLVTVVTTAACGRVSFDAQLDAQLDAHMADADLLALHDEDGDGINDRDDLCPHIADSDQADNDGDRVGNACDPLTDAALERIVFFDPMLEPSSAWEFRLGTPTYTGEAVTADLRNGELFMTLTGLTPDKDHFVVGGSFGAVSPTNARQLYIAAAETDLEFTYCEVYETMAVDKWGLVWTPDYNLFYTEAAGALSQPLENQAIRMSLQHVPQTSELKCETTFPVDMPMLTAPVSSAITPTKYMLYAMGVELRIDYVIVIRTDPP